LGGRIQTIKTTKTGQHVDVGAHWVGRSQKYLMNLVTHFNLDLRTQWLQGTKVMQLSDNKVRTYNSTLPQLGSYFALLELGWVMHRIDSISRKVNTLDPYASITNAHEYDSLTIESWLKSNTRSQSVRDVVTAAVSSGICS